jgi:hypothetical protein
MFLGLGCQRKKSRQAIVFLAGGAEAEKLAFQGKKYKIILGGAKRIKKNTAVRCFHGRYEHDFGYALNPRNRIIPGFPFLYYFSLDYLKAHQRSRENHGHLGIGSSGVLLSVIRNAEMPAAPDDHGKDGYEGPSNPIR